MKERQDLMAAGLLDSGELSAARRYLNHRPDEEKSSYRFLRDWCELLYRESRSADLREFGESIHADSDDLRALVALGRVRAFYLESAWKNAAELGEEVLQSSLSPADPLLIPEIQTVTGAAWGRLREISKAIAAHEAALEAYKISGNSPRIAARMASLAGHLQAGRDWDASVGLYSQAISILAQNGDVRTLAIVVLNRGNMHLFRGRFFSAKEDLNRANWMAEDYGMPGCRASSQAMLGLLELRTGFMGSAADRLVHAMRIAPPGNAAGRIRCVTADFAGELRTRQGRYRSARFWLHRAIDLAQDRGFPDVENSARYRLAEVEAREGNFKLAESLANEASGNFKEMKDEFEIAVSQRVLGEIHWRQGRQEDANAVFEQANDFFRAIGETYESNKIASLRAGLPEPTPEESRASFATGPLRAEASELASSTEATIATSLPSRSKRSQARPRGRRSGDLPRHPLFPELLCASPAFRSALDRVARLATSEASILILGDTGTGKEAVAGGIHRLSRRAEKSFVPFNCAMSTPELFDADFYGHTKGAFTGADGVRSGLARQANGGTLFLDEIGELSLDTQARVLRFFDSGEIRSVGSDTTEQTDIRLVSATHRPLEKMVDTGNFRADLRFRLAEVTVTLPSLCDRPEDIPILVDHYLDEARAKGIGDLRSVGQPVIDTMLRYSWPGNVRELRNEVFKIVSEHRDASPATKWKRPEKEGPGRAPSRDELVEALTQCGGNIAAVGRLLGHNRITLYRLMEKFDLQPTDFRGS